MNETSVSVAGMAFAFGVLALITTVIVTAVLSTAGTRKARASAAREQAYQDLATAAAEHQAGARAALDDIQRRVVAIEKLLRDVG